MIKFTKIFILLIFAGVMSWLIGHDIKIEQNIVTSLQNNVYDDHEAWDVVKSSGFYDKKIFIRYKNLSQSELAHLKSGLISAEYRPSSLVDMDILKSGSLKSFVPMLDSGVLKAWVETINPEDVADQLERYLALPGSDDLIHQMIVDPFSVSSLVINRLMKDISHDSNEKVITEVWERGEGLDYDKIGHLVEHLSGFGDRISYIGGDFFSFDNYLAVKRDINLCIALSFILNIMLMLYFCRRLDLLVYLAIGTWISYIFGLGLVSLFYDEVYAIVFAFTATFVGFNNEYLIHLSGHKKGEFARSLTGLGSAIGTTFIGFIVLLFSESVIVRQMAIVSIGGMVGFIGFMLFIQTEVNKIDFKPVSIKRLYAPRFCFPLVLVITGLMILLVRWPVFNTNIKNFSFQSERLTEVVERFQSFGQSGPSWQSVYGMRVDGPFKAAWDNFANQAASDAPFHPLSYYKDSASQIRADSDFRSLMSPKYQQINSILARRGLNLSLEPADFIPMDVSEYLDRWNQLSPIPWSYKGEHSWIFFNAKPGLYKDVELVYSLSPLERYNRILNQMQHGMSLLFLIGLLMMALYLIPWQKSFVNISYIFSPLLLSVLVLMIILNLSDQSVNIIHIMGLALVIALALDYSSISVSSKFSKKEESKVALTGFSAIAAFGALCFARHPVLKDLGLVVTTGAFISLIFSLFTGIRGDRNQSPG